MRPHREQGRRHGFGMLRGNLYKHDYTQVQEGEALPRLDEIVFVERSDRTQRRIIRWISQSHRHLQWHCRSRCDRHSCAGGTCFCTFATNSSLKSQLTVANDGTPPPTELQRPRGGATARLVKKCLRSASPAMAQNAESVARLSRL